MFAFLLIVQTLIAGSLVGVILMQRSEGGGLGVGGSSSGFMTARGAADFLTRSTAFLGGAFIILSIIMAAIAGATRTPTKIDTTLAGKTTVPVQQQTQPLPTQPAQTAPASGNTAEQNQQAPAVPLAQ
jgi:preprotein translocase subunit SecG